MWPILPAYDWSPPASPTSFPPQLSLIPHSASLEFWQVREHPGLSSAIWPAPCSFLCWEHRFPTCLQGHFLFLIFSSTVTSWSWPQMINAFPVHPMKVPPHADNSLFHLSVIFLPTLTANRHMLAMCLLFLLVLLLSLPRICILWG